MTDYQKIPFQQSSGLLCCNTSYSVLIKPRIKENFSMCNADLLILPSHFVPYRISVLGRWVYWLPKAICSHSFYLMPCMFRVKYISRIFFRDPTGLSLPFSHHSHMPEHNAADPLCQVLSKVKLVPYGNQINSSVPDGISSLAPTCHQRAQYHTSYNHLELL